MSRTVKKKDAAYGFLLFIVLLLLMLLLLMLLLPQFGPITN
jgi:type II secretory pathway component PulF